ncbi:unnamed protein product [Oikopleura dioica]|uniref:EXS domain-containing protein n=1 Tax=Oikopleura dioica TaxID=34765 RepID=E4XW53_OIKDI|nr:unnamed protein product [Oikopleura dioica]
MTEIRFDQSDTPLGLAQKEKVSAEFFEAVEVQLQKVNLFFNEKISAANRQLADITRNCDDFDLMTKKDVKHLKEAICEFYLFVQKLKTFQELNFEAFRKINKKHDKIMNKSTGNDFMKDNIDNSRFNLRSLTLNIRYLEPWTTLEGGDSKQAMNKLRVPPITDVVHGKTNEFLFILGVLVGISLVFLLAIAFIVNVENSGIELEENLPTIILLFRPTLLIAIFIIFFSMNMYGWANAGVNSVLIFELNPRDRLSAVQMACIGFGFLALWLVFLFIYLLLSSKLIFLSLSPYVNYIPISLDLILILFAFTPAKGTGLWSTQLFFWKLILREVKAGFIPVAFVDFWFADQLNSLGQVFLDFQQTICLIATKDIPMNFVPNYEDNNDPALLNSTSIAEIGVCGESTFAEIFRFFFWILPAYIRFAQCIRRAIDSQKRRGHHFQNAAKYSTSFLKVAMSYALQYSGKAPAAFGFWIITNVVASVFTLVWDLRMDWGLLHLEKKQILRDELIYGHGETNWIYFLAIIQDILFRFAWIAKYFIGINTSSGLGQVWTSLFAVIELIRRFVWNFFRLENEHLNNCGEFRAVREISLVVVNESEIAKLEEIMDEEKDRLLEFHRRPAIKNTNRFRNTVQKEK